MAPAKNQNKIKIEEKAEIPKNFASHANEASYKYNSRR
jgi:hypothetical protein